MNLMPSVDDSETRLPACRIVFRLQNISETYSLAWLREKRKQTQLTNSCSMALRGKTYIFRRCMQQTTFDISPKGKSKDETGVRRRTTFSQGIQFSYKDSVSMSKQTTMSATATGDDLNTNTNKVIKPYLAVFDFDYTVAAQNTDTIVRDLLPSYKLTKDLQDIIEVQGWTEYMAEVFRRLQEVQIKPEKIVQTIHAIPEVPGFVRMLKRLNTKYGCDLIIISDSNSLFIEEWLKSHGLTDNFTKVFTNPASFADDTGLLTIQPYHHQTDCRLSSVNLCKGKVLEHFLVEQDLRYNLTYERVIYVGDGNNDICPVTKLRQRDVACPREGFSMDKTLTKNPLKLKVRAELVTWKTGFDLLDKLERHMEKIERQKQQEQKTANKESPQQQCATMEVPEVH